MSDSTSPAAISVVDLTIHRYDRADPVYSFFTSFPSRGLQTTEPCPTKEEAYALATQRAADYRAADPYGNVAELIGVTPEGAQFRGVWNRFHSNT